MSDAVRTITAVGTSRPAFVGDAAGAPTRPTLISGWSEFTKSYGDAVSDKGSYLAEAVYGFFANGGTSCYVVSAGGNAARVQAYRSVLTALESVADVNMVTVPDLWQAEEDGAEIGKSVAGHCARVRNRLAILHLREGLDAADAEKPRSVFDIVAGADESDFTTVYYPWVGVPGVAGDPRTVPASGHVAGIWARTDAERGVFKAPANQTLRGVLELERRLTDDENGSLHQGGVNCLRQSPGRGILVWGAHTLSSSRDWKYVNVRRLASFLSDSIRSSIGWVVAEPNDERLRASLREAVTPFLTDQWRQGALMGRNPDEAFYVICDETNNTAATADRVVIDIGIAPVRPAEFIHFTITHPTA
ncbi:phage tail sheath family protein [Streptomyces exfoliatus]|uniref:phage tail sheath family protein n=1 Tax=Streptomyces exfoliatus TaxID=1905 RepID=UPI003C2CB30D